VLVLVLVLGLVLAIVIVLDIDYNSATSGRHGSWPSGSNDPIDDDLR
jgi:hypothetical protein